MINATPEMQPLAAWNPILGIWERPNLDLFGQQEPYSEIWWTSGMTRNGSVYPLPQSERPISAFAYLSSPTRLFRTPLASDASRGGETLQQVKARRGTIALSHQIIDLVLHGPQGYSQEEDKGTLWNLIEKLFNDGDHTLPPSSDGKA